MEPLNTVPPLLEVRHLNYEYQDDEPALMDISINVYPGERIAVLGSNGAGKSTFFLNINGVLPPKSGEIRYRGSTIKKKNLKELRKQVGIVFQDADNQIIASTVLAEVSFGPMNLKLPKEEVWARVNEALAYMDLLEFKSRPPHYLSGGEKKRVSIADILAMEPEIIIFDEPTAALDPKNAAMLEEVLGKLANEKKTILLSTHDVDFAYRWAERVVVFHGGKILLDGTPQDVFSQEEMLRQANLKKPMLLDLCEFLSHKGILPVKGCTARTVAELKKLISEAQGLTEVENTL